MKKQFVSVDYVPLNPNSEAELQKAEETIHIRIPLNAEIVSDRPAALVYLDTEEQQFLDKHPDERLLTKILIKFAKAGFRLARNL